MLSVTAVTQSYQHVVFTVTITYPDGTVIWAAVTTNNKIIFGELNRLDISLSSAGKIKFYFIEKIFD